MRTNKCTLLIDANWLLLSRFSVIKKGFEINMPEVAKEHAQCELQELMAKSMHPYVITATPEAAEVLSGLQALVELKKEAKIEFAIPLFEKAEKFAEEAVKKAKPNFFTLAYYKYANPEANLDDMEIEEMNAMTRKYLDDNFMTDFIQTIHTISRGLS